MKLQSSSIAFVSIFSLFNNSKISLEFMFPLLFSSPYNFIEYFSLFLNVAIACASISLSMFVACVFSLKSFIVILLDLFDVESTIRIDLFFLFISILSSFVAKTNLLKNVMLPIKIIIIANIIFVFFGSCSFFSININIKSVINIINNSPNLKSTPVFSIGFTEIVLFSSFLLFLLSTIFESVLLFIILLMLFEITPLFVVLFSVVLFLI